MRQNSVTRARPFPLLVQANGRSEGKGIQRIIISCHNLIQRKQETPLEATASQYHGQHIFSSSQGCCFATSDHSIGRHSLQLQQGNSNYLSFSSDKTCCRRAIVPHFILFPLVTPYQTEDKKSDIHESTLRGPARQLQFRDRQVDGGGYGTGFGEGGGTVNSTGNLGYSVINATGSGGGYGGGFGSTSEGNSSSILSGGNGGGFGRGGGNTFALAADPDAADATNIFTATSTSFGSGRGGGDGGGLGGFSTGESGDTPDVTAYTYNSYYYAEEQGDSKGGKGKKDDEPTVIVVIVPVPTVPEPTDYAVAYGSGSGYADGFGEGSGTDLGIGSVYANGDGYAYGSGSGYSDVVVEGEAVSGGGGGVGFGGGGGEGTGAFGGLFNFGGRGGGFSAGGGGGTLGNRTRAP
jgi:hypothetical protein